MQGGYDCSEWWYDTRLWFIKWLFIDAIGKDFLEFTLGDGNYLKNRARGTQDPNEFIVTLLI
jgi:hypothetical protein